MLVSSSTPSMAAPLARHVRERTRPGAKPATLNVGDGERLASLALGGSLAFYGIMRGTLGGMGLTLLGGALMYRGGTGHCSGYEALGINTAQPRGARTSVRAQRGARVEESVTILRPREELFRYWRDLSNLPRIMRHLQSVQSTGDGRSHWVAKGPMGILVEWDAEVITERENELIGWRSVGDSEVDTAGSVHFTTAPGDRGTEVKVVLKYDPPAGQIGVAVARLLGESPSQQIHDDLRRFKQIMEVGTVPTTEGQSKGTCH